MTEENYELIDSGYTAKVYRIPGTQTVCKIFQAKHASSQFQVEVEAYTRLSSHNPPSSILQYHGISPDIPYSLILSYAAKGSLYKYIYDSQIYNTRPTPPTLYRWAQQAATALSYAHQHNILHADIHTSNFVLDENLDLKLCDFGGASIDGGISWSFYRLTHRLFGEEGDVPTMEITVASEIFALGSALFSMVGGEDLFPELDYKKDRAEIVGRFMEKRFPDTSSLLVLGDVILDCWNLRFATMEEVLERIVAERDAAQVMGVE